MQPELLPPNVFQHQYRGGGRIARLRGLSTAEIDQPEEWLGSTTRMLHESEKGLSSTRAGARLADLIAADPVSWLGRQETDTGLLFKLIDAGQRGPVHAHPDSQFAKLHLENDHGKTEAWLILEARQGAGVYVGWREAVAPRELAEHRDAQDAAWMISRMNRVDVSPGTAVVVPAGQVHAVDDGLLIAEIQEPTDFSIVLEWSATTLSRDNSELGLGWDLASEAIEHGALGRAELEGLVTRNEIDQPVPGVDELLSPVAAPLFSLRRVASRADQDSGFVDPAFGVAFVLRGHGTIEGETGGVEARQGDVFAIPHDLGRWRLTGDGLLLFATGVASAG